VSPQANTGQEDSTQFQKNVVKSAILKNWKTTTVGIVLATTGFIAYSPKNFGGDQALIVELSKYVHMGGLATLGIVAKDYNVTGNGS
jgi:hypothetical protein